MRSDTGNVQEGVGWETGREAGLAQVRREASQSRTACQPLILKDRCQPIRGDTGHFPLRHAVNTSVYARGLLPAGHGLRGKCPISPLTYVVSSHAWRSVPNQLRCLYAGDD